MVLKKNLSMKMRARDSREELTDDQIGTEAVPSETDVSSIMQRSSMI